MTVKVDGINGLTFADNSTQNVTALNASNITSGTLGKARLPTGSVLQVVQASSTTVVTTTTTTYADLFSLSITPNFTSSRIMLLFFVPVYTTANAIPELKLQRNSGDLQTFGFWQHINTGAYILSYPASAHIDSPSSTSALTYTLQGRTRGGTVNWVYSDGNGTMIARMIALEIAS